MTIQDSVAYCIVQANGAHTTSRLAEEPEMQGMASVILLCNSMTTSACVDLGHHLSGSTAVQIYRSGLSYLGAVDRLVSVFCHACFRFEVLSFVFCEKMHGWECRGDGL